MSFLERYKDLVISAAYGASFPYEESNKMQVENKLNSANRHGYNPDFDNILDEINDVLVKHNPKISGLKADLGINRSDFLIYYMSFADWHNLKEDNKFSVFSKGTISTIKSIENESSKTKEPTGIGKQLELALEQAENDLTLASIYLALGTRAICRGLDNRIFGSQQFSDESIENWKLKIKSFGINNELDDNEGDLYHFWHGVVAGLARNENVDFVLSRSLKQFCSDFIYLNAAKAVGYFRNTLNLKINSDTHEIPDLLGYSIGQALYSLNEDIIV